MARQTRSQRRARREAQALSGGGDGAALERGRARTPQVRPTAQPAPAQPSRGSRSAGFIRFVQESAAELKKVEWPTQQQLIQGTAVVLIACAVVGLYLWLADLVFKRLVENVFLGQ